MPAALDISSSRLLLGVVLKMPGPAYVEMAGHFGADLVVIDTEHGVADAAQVESHVRAGDSVPVPVLVRVPGHGARDIQSALDAGAAGVVVPHVSDVTMARRVVAAAHYPPFGTRGLALTTRAGQQGSAELEQHLHMSRQNTVVVGQIEDVPAAQAAAEIASVEGMSAIWIGTNDLAMSMRSPSSTPAASEVDNLAAAACSDAAASGISSMIVAANVHQVDLWKSRGVNIILVTAHQLFRDSLRGYLSAVRGNRS